MHHFLICKYNYDDPAYVDEWTTLSALLRSTGSQFPSQDYLQLEQAFLDIVVQFFKAHADRSFRFRFCYICGDHKVQDPSSGNLQSLLLPLPDGLALIGKPFERLSPLERLALFQLAVRGVVSIVVESIDDPVVVLSTVDDGFYWFVSLTEECEPESLVMSDLFYIYESIDIFDPA